MKIKEHFGRFAAGSFAVFERMFFRTLVLALFTFAALTVADALVTSGMGDRFAIVRRFPEFIPMMMAAAKFTFIEVSLLWIRFGVQPKVNVQEGVYEATGNPMAAALVYFTHSLVWFARVCVFIYLMG